MGIRFFITSIVKPTNEYATTAAVSPTIIPALCIIIEMTHNVSMKAGRRLKIDRYKNWLLARNPRSKALLAKPDLPSSCPPPTPTPTAGVRGAVEVGPPFPIN